MLIDLPNGQFPKRFSYPPILQILYKYVTFVFPIRLACLAHRELLDFNVKGKRQDKRNETGQHTVMLFTSAPTAANVNTDLGVVFLYLHNEQLTRARGNKKTQITIVIMEHKANYLKSRRKIGWLIDHQKQI
jgi:hypothetical protein